MFTSVMVTCKGCHVCLEQYEMYLYVHQFLTIQAWTNLGCILSQKCIWTLCELKSGSALLFCLLFLIFLKVHLLDLLFYSSVLHLGSEIKQHHVACAIINFYYLLKNILFWDLAWHMMEWGFFLYLKGWLLHYAWLELRLYTGRSNRQMPSL